MKRYLLFKLLAINLIIIGFGMVIVWIAVDQLAAGYFVTLMEKYNISPEPAHAMFLSAVHRYLVWATLGAVLLAVVLSYALTRRALAPLTQMAVLSREIAAGNYTVRVPVKTKDEVGQLAEAFNRMVDSLKSIEGLRRTLMIDVAHELRTPLTNIRGYLEALHDGILPPSQATFAMLQEETIRLARLVEDVLRLARADAAHGKLVKESVALQEVIKEALEPFAKAITQKHLSLTIEEPGGPVSISVDRSRFSRVLRNLAENAVRYAPRSSSVTIRIAANGIIRVVYSNEAPDLAPDDLPYLFERFYRGEKSRSRRHGGAGIGLAIVKELVEAHGGTVFADLADKRISIGFALPREQPSA